MGMNISYKKSIRKQLGLVIGLLVFLVVCGWLLAPVEGLRETIVVGGMVIFASIVVLLRTRKAATALCPACQKDLFEILEAANTRAMKLRYCPFCGSAIEP